MLMGVLLCEFLECFDFSEKKDGSAVPSENLCLKTPTSFVETLLCMGSNGINS